LIPGILQLMIFLVTVFSIGSEIKFATSHEWLRLGNNSVLVSLAGKLLPHTFDFYVSGVVGLFASLRIQCISASKRLDADGGKYIFACTGFASSWSVYDRSVANVTARTEFCQFIRNDNFLNCRVVVPRFRNASYAARLANLFPLRHYFLIYVDQALNGRELIYCWGHYVALMAFMILPFLIARNLKHALLYFKYIP
jgi:hypothetical protein